MKQKQDFGINRKKLQNKVILLKLVVRSHHLINTNPHKLKINLFLDPNHNGIRGQNSLFSSFTRSLVLTRTFMY